MDYFNYKNGQYFAEDVSLSRVADEIGTPFYCYSTATLVRHFEVFTKSLNAKDMLVAYAVKANNNLGVLKTLATCGAGADVVSEGEIRFARAAGVPANKIIFSGVAKTRSEMAYALKEGIFQFNVESEPELRQLSEVAAGLGATAHIALRVNPDVVAGTHIKISTGQKESKFGVSMNDATRLYALAATLSGIKVQGVSVHIGSQLTSLEPFAQAFARVAEFVLQLRREGHTITTLDLGGGLGIPYGQEEPPHPDAYAEIVHKNVESLGCKLIFEPGRLMVGNAGILVSRVVYVKHSGGRVFVMLDAGMNDSIRPTLYNAFHEVTPVAVPSGEAPTEFVDLVGPVCENGDIFAEQRLMKVPNAGDLLVLRSAGAYGAVMASTYNARPLIAEVMVKGDKYAVTRARQTYEQMLGQYRLPDWF